MGFVLAKGGSGGHRASDQNEIGSRGGNLFKMVTGSTVLSHFHGVGDLLKIDLGHSRTGTSKPKKV